MKNLTGKPIDGDVLEHVYSVPSIAHRHKDVYCMDDSCVDAELDPTTISRDAYKQYVFLGRLPVDKFPTRSQAKAAARDKFDPKANVFRTAKYFVAYKVL